MIIKCLHETTLYCNELTGYTIASYKTADGSSIPKEAVSKYRPKNGMTAFTAVGNRLPTAVGVEIELSGKWDNGGKYGMQLAVNSCSIVRPKTSGNLIYTAITRAMSKVIIVGQKMLFSKQSIELMLQRGIRC